jgi:hypothetical protein
MARTRSPSRTAISEVPESSQIDLGCFDSMNVWGRRFRGEVVADNRPACVRQTEREYRLAESLNSESEWHPNAERRTALRLVNDSIQRLVEAANWLTDPGASVDAVASALVLADRGAIALGGRSMDHSARMALIEEIARRGSWAIGNPSALEDLMELPDEESQFAVRWPTFWERLEPSSFAEAVRAWTTSERLPRNGRWKQVAATIAGAGLSRCRPESLHRQWMRWSRPEVWRRPFPEV